MTLGSCVQECLKSYPGFAECVVGQVKLPVPIIGYLQAHGFLLTFLVSGQALVLPQLCIVCCEELYGYTSSMLNTVWHLMHGNLS